MFNKSIINFTNNKNTLFDMKNIIYSLVLFCLFSCSRETTSEPMLNDGQITLSLELIREFSLQLDNSSSKSLLLEDSDFVHVYDSEITVNFTSVPPGYSESLTFNPNDNTQRVTLPYGEYNWEIPSEDNPSPISNTLSVSGQSTSVITINEPSVDLTLNVNTDYALVTVNDDYTSNVTLTHEDLSLSMNIKDGYNYGYVLSGTTSSSISVIDTNGDNYTGDLGLIQSCKHYKYQLDYSDVGVNSLICLCEPFEVIERFLIPSSVCGQWSKILSSEEIPSYFDLDNFNISTQFALNKENLEFYFIDPSGKLVTYSIEDNSFTEQNVNFAIGNMRDHIYNPIINKIQYVRAGRETVYELNLNTLESTVSFNGSSDSNHYNGIYFFNSFTDQIGHYGGYGFFRSKNSMANYSSNSSTWELSIEDSSTAPYRRFGSSRRWLLPNHDYSKLIIVGGVGNQSGQQGSSCESPLVNFINNDFCFLTDVWEINLNDYSLNQISGFDNEGLNSFGINGYDYEKNILVKYIGSEPYNVLNEELKYFKINSSEEGWVLVDQTGDVPTIISDDINGSFFYEESSNKFYLIKSDGVWTLDMNCD